MERPTYTDGQPLDVETRLRQIGAADLWFGMLGFGAAGACLINGLVLFFSCRRDEKAA